MYEISLDIIFKDYKYYIDYWTYRDSTFTMLLVTIKNIVKDIELLKNKYNNSR